MGRFKSTLGTIEHMRRLCYLGGHPEPAWLKAWMQYVMGCSKVGEDPGLCSSGHAHIPKRCWLQDGVTQHRHGSATEAAQVV